MTDENKKTDKQIVKSELIELYDEFVYLNEVCCFLLDAGSVMRINDQLFDKRSVGGYRQCSEALKGRLADFKAKLKLTCVDDVVS